MKIKSFVLSFCIMIFSVNVSNAHVGERLQIGVACAKLPALVIADSCYFGGQEKEAAFFDAMYHLLSLSEVGLKLYNDSDNVTFLEMACAIYDALCLVQGVSLLWKHDDNVETYGSMEAESSLQTDNVEQVAEHQVDHSFKRVLYAFCKYSGAFLDFCSSLGFVVAGADIEKPFFSQFGVCARIFSRSFDNRVPEISSKIGVAASLLGTFVVTQKFAKECERLRAQAQARAWEREREEAFRQVLADADAEAMAGRQDEWDDDFYDDYIAMYQGRSPLREPSTWRPFGYVDEPEPAQRPVRSARLSALQEAFHYNRGGDECIICAEDLRERGRVGVLGCHHMYCTNCIDRVRQNTPRNTTPTCPNCRAPIRVVDEYELLPENDDNE